MRLRLIREVLATLVPVPRPVRSFYTEVMRRKKDDHVASHSDTINQLFHILSSSAFLGCYVLAFWDLTTAMWAGLAALFLRQFGHAILEPPCHDKEATLLGYNTRNKTLILGTYLAIPIVNVVWSGALRSRRCVRWPRRSPMSCSRGPRRWWPDASRTWCGRTGRAWRSSGS